MDTIIDITTDGAVIRLTLPSPRTWREKLAAIWRMLWQS